MDVDVLGSGAEDGNIEASKSLNEPRCSGGNVSVGTRFKDSLALAFPLPLPLALALDPGSAGSAAVMLKKM